ncbi:MAG: four helix bundle protein [Saprospiraceae bacterium]
MSTPSVYQTWGAFIKGFSLASAIFKISKSFPKEECYSLTDQIRRSSRSVCANLAESFAKQRYPKHFIAKITDAAGENFETQSWLLFALDSRYINQKEYDELIGLSIEVGKLLTYMERNPAHFAWQPKQKMASQAVHTSYHVPNTTY